MPPILHTIERDLLARAAANPFGRACTITTMFAGCRRPGRGRAETDRARRLAARGLLTLTDVIYDPEPREGRERLTSASSVEYLWTITAAGRAALNEA